MAKNSPKLIGEWAVGQDDGFIYNLIWMFLYAYPNYTEIISFLF